MSYPESLNPIDRMFRVGENFVRHRKKISERIQTIDVMASDGEIYSMDKATQKHSISKTELRKLIGGRPENADKIIQDCIDKEIILPPVKIGKSSTEAYPLSDQVAILRYMGRPFNSISLGRNEYQPLKPLVVAIANRKGGTGKSTVTVALASKLALDLSMMARVLVIDLDSQGSDVSICRLPDDPADVIDLTFTDILLGPLEDPEQNETSLLEDEYGFDELVKRAPFPTHIPTLHILPSLPNDERLVQFEGMADESNLIFDRFHKALEILKEDYDYILFDTPPTDSYHTWLAMDSADYILTPFRPHELDFDSTGLFLSSAPRRLRTLPSGGNNLKDFKVLITDHDKKSNAEHEIKHRAIALADGSITSGQIEHSEAFKYASATAQTIWDMHSRDVSRGQLVKAITSTEAVYESFKADLTRIAKS